MPEAAPLTTPGAVFVEQEQLFREMRIRRCAIYAHHSPREDAWLRCFVRRSLRGSIALVTMQKEQGSSVQCGFVDVLSARTTRRATGPDGALSFEVEAECLSRLKE